MHRFPPQESQEFVAALQKAGRTYSYFILSLAVQRHAAGYGSCCQRFSTAECLTSVERTARFTSG